MKNYLPPLFLLCFFLLLIGNPKEGIAAAADGLALWYSQVLPALFPSMILTSLLIRTNLLFFLFSRWRITQKLPLRFLLPAAAGILCGYPIGAKTCCDLYHAGVLTKEEVCFESSFVQFPSPMFLLGFVCTVCLPDANRNALLTAIYLPLPLLILLSAACSPGLFQKHKKTASANIFFVKKPCFSMDMFDDVYNKSVGILIKIAGYLMLFTMLNRLLMHLAPSLELPLVLTGGILEMTYGIRTVSSFLLPAAAKQCICVFFLGFGGFSGMLQVRDALTAPLFHTGRYLIFRFLHGVLAAFIYWLLH